MVGKVLSKDDIVIYESTVYPGCTEEYVFQYYKRNPILLIMSSFFVDIVLKELIREIKAYIDKDT